MIRRTWFEDWLPYSPPCLVVRHYVPALVVTQSRQVQYPVTLHARQKVRQEFSDERKDILIFLTQ